MFIIAYHCPWWQSTSWHKYSGASKNKNILKSIARLSLMKLGNMSYDEWVGECGFNTSEKSIIDTKPVSYDDI